MALRFPLPPAVLVALVLVVAAAIAGVSASPENAVQILGFGSMVAIGLMALLRIEKVGVNVQQVHVLVNDAHGAALRAIAVVSRRLAIVTKDPDDLSAALVAEQASIEHDRKQAKMDQEVR